MATQTDVYNSTVTGCWRLAESWRYASLNNLTRAMKPATCVVRVFFFQAEDGIRDVAVTGVQTCALPISLRARARRRSRGGDGRAALRRSAAAAARREPERGAGRPPRPRPRRVAGGRGGQIGRASCRERV